MTFSLASSPVQPAAVPAQSVSADAEPDIVVSRQVRPAPDRYRNALGKYKLNRSADCVACGECVKLCPQGVHVKPDGYTFTLRPLDHL